MPYSHHQCQTSAGEAGPVTGGGGLRVSFMYTVIMCMLVIMVPPIMVGVWSMLRQHVEYYY